VEEVTGLFLFPEEGGFWKEGINLFIFIVNCGYFKECCYFKELWDLQWLLCGYI
jgi:hypothetical protein